MRPKIATILCLIFAALALAQDALTNESVIKMVKGGLGDDVIVSTVKAQPAKYATDPDGLIALKTAGVSDKVIAAIVDRMAASDPTPPPHKLGVGGKAMVYVYRYRQYMGAALSPSVYCDEQELARMENGRYFGVRVDAGKHSFRSNDQQSVIDLDANAGEIYYIRVDIATGFFKGHGRLSLMPAPQGGAEARKLKPLGAHQVKDSGRVILDPLGQLP